MGEATRMITITDDRGRVLPYKTLVFSGGEVQVRVDKASYGTTTKITITAYVSSANDLMEVFLAKDAVSRLDPFCSVDLVLPYLPYSRQDRVCYPGESFSLAVIARLLNSSGFTRVKTWDVHSVVASGLIVGFENVPAADFVSKIKFETLPIVVAPDAGAVTRAAQCARALNTSVMHAQKKRNPDTGAIVGIDFKENHVGDRDFLIVDDICDGGRTFIELAKVLRQKTRGSVMLYVTHGIFSQGEAVFDSLIDKVYTANLFPNKKKVSSIISI